MDDVLDSGTALEAGEILDRLGTRLFRAVPRREWNTVALSTLSRLCRAGPLRLGDLVAAEAMSQPGMTGLVSRMEAAGLLERADDPSDGRAVLVSATPVGHAYLAEVHAARAELLARHVAALDPEDRAALTAALPALDRLITPTSEP